MSARSQTDTASLAPSASANPHRSAGGAGPGSTTGGGTGLLGRARPATAAALLAARRATAQEQAKAAAEEQEEQDPIYQVRPHRRRRWWQCTRFCSASTYRVHGRVFVDGGRAGSTYTHSRTPERARTLHHYPNLP